VSAHTPHRVQLVGHRSLGVVRARWLGCILELEDGTRYGPSALFEVKALAEPGLLIGWTYRPNAMDPGPLWHLMGARDGREITEPLATVGTSGWTGHATGKRGRHGGLHGKEDAVEDLLETGWVWPPSTKDNERWRGHDTRSLKDLSGRVITMTDGTEKRVSTSYGEDVLFEDKTWIGHNEAQTAIAYVHPRNPDDDIPF